MSTIRFIGDVHGYFERYKKIIDGCPASIQVGDLGLGFRHTQGPREGEFTQNPPHYKMTEGNHRFIRGNHDNPGECNKNSQWIKDGTVEDGVMFIGGAESIDIPWRVKDYSWWEDEQLSDDEFNVLIDKFIMEKPHTVISHDCPVEVAEIMCDFRFKPESRTQRALQAMWNGHSPDRWIFGHWHVHQCLDLEKDKKLTKFICLEELQYMDINL